MSDPYAHRFTNMAPQFGGQRLPPLGVVESAARQGMQDQGMRGQGMSWFNNAALEHLINTSASTGTLPAGHILGRVTETIQAGDSMQYVEVLDRWRLWQPSEAYLFAKYGIAVTAGVEGENIIIQVAGLYGGVLSQRPAMVTEFSGILSPCPAALDNANIAILGPEVLPSLSFRHITEAERAALQPLAVFPPAPPGSLCELCLDASACVLMPAPWGGDMGVCMMCAKQHAGGVAMTGDASQAEASYGVGPLDAPSMDASED